MAQNPVKYVESKQAKLLTLVDQEVLQDLIHHFRYHVPSLMCRPKTAFGLSSQNTPLTHDQLKLYVLEKVNQRLFREKGSISSEELSSITSYLHEIGHDNNTAVVNILASILFRVLETSLKGLYVPVKKIAEVQTMLRPNPVIFLPTHRSYADFVLIAYMSFVCGLELPCVAAGIDFYNMVVMGKILRKCRAFYMKRTFTSDLLYKKVFEEYLSAMFMNHLSPVEFFIEGTRSRSLKSLPPKFGLLNTIAETYIRGEVSDITIVPISISYERVIEEKLFSYEHLGVPKPKESTAILIKSLAFNSVNFGNFAIGIGSPFNISSYLKKVPNFHERNREREKKQIQKLAQDVMHRHQEISYITLFNIVAIAFSDHILRSTSYVIAIDDLCKKIEIVIDLLQHYNAKLLLTERPVHNKNLQTCIHEHCTLMEWIGTDSKVKFLDNMKHSMKNTGDLRNSLREETMMCAIPRIMLQLYVNPTINLICQAGIIVTIVHYQKGLNLGNLFNQFHLLFTLFKREFVCCDFLTLKEFKNQIDKLVDMKCITIKHETYFEDEKELSHILLNMLEPFIVGYFYIAEFLLTLEEDIWVPNCSLRRQIQNHIEQKFIKGSLKNMYCLSLDLIGNGISSFKNLGALKLNIQNQYSVSKKRLQFYLLLLSNCISSNELLNSASLRPKL